MNDHSQTDRTRVRGVEPSSIDPVCGITITPERTAFSHEHEGVTCYLCSLPCLHQFRAAPQAFLKQAPPQIAHGKKS
ncbi:MAG: YHS domain-containing protein [Acidobacteria bacterium]|nr:YHS domain-containing protein [Acidobacteriota bacterium]